MQNFYLNWGADFASEETEVDRFYKQVLDAGILMYQYLNHDCPHTDYVLELAHEINKLVSQHMNYELATLKKLGISDYKVHLRDHEYLRKRFDIDMQYDVSDKMRIIMCAKMLKTFFKSHFLDFDLFYLEELRNHFKNPQRLYM